MKLYILQYNNGSIGRLISIDTNMYSTVKSIKRHIKRMYGIPIYRQSLFLVRKNCQINFC